MALAARHDEERKVGVVAGNNPGLEALQQTTGIEAHVRCERRGRREAEFVYHTAQHRAEILVPGVKTHLNGIANKGNVVLVKGKLFTRGYALLQFHQTDGMALHPDDTLGDPVLDLDTWIDFEKVGFPLLINQKLDRGCAAQMDSGAQAECISANALQGCLAPLQAGNTRGSNWRIELGDLLGNRLWV